MGPRASCLAGEGHPKIYAAWDCLSAYWSQGSHVPCGSTQKSLCLPGVPGLALPRALQTPPGPKNWAPGTVLRMQKRPRAILWTCPRPPKPHVWVWGRLRMS